MSQSIKTLLEQYIARIQEIKGANNRAYYAVFHVINAVHALNGNGLQTPQRCDWKF